MKTDEIASKFLGKRVSGSENYDPSLLVAIPREENRKQYNLRNDKLPFCGWDIWHAYEFSAMTENGIPVTRLIKLKYSCNSEFLVESKSLKLYLNSFNMSRFGQNIEELQTEVRINFIDNKTQKVQIFQNFQNIMQFVNEKDITVEKFKEAPEVLQTKGNEETKEYYLTFDSLRSNCRVTHQPDFGDMFLYYKSKKHITEKSLVKYLSSFRSEYHFHEECCEMIFKRLSDILNKGDKLLVCALYTRRGGIDICPSRWTKNCEIKDVEILNDITKFARGSIKQ